MVTMLDEASSSGRLSPPPDTSTLPEASSSTAPYRHLPRTHFVSVEYPGTVSHPSALLKVTTQEEINECFNQVELQQKEKKKEKDPAFLEIKYRMDDRNGVPVRGNRVDCQKLLLRIRRRRRKGADESDDTGDDSAQKTGRERTGALGGRTKGNERAGEKGVFIADVLGPIDRTVRFRHFHYTPNPDTRISQLVESLRGLDYDAILDYTVAPLSETFVEKIPSAAPGGEPTFRSLMDLQPPPMFISRTVPPIYSYRHAPGSILQEYEDPQTGETRMRYLNKDRGQQIAPQRIGHEHARGSAPIGPVKAVQSKIEKLDQDLWNKVKAKRPVWLRYALYQNFTPQEQKLLTNEKAYLASNCYVFGAGPYWKCMVRLGYDPCYDPSAYIYQRIYFYLEVKRRSGMILQPSSIESDEEGDEEDQRNRGWWETEQEKLVAAGERAPLDETKGHIFDGQVINRDKPDYQLIDITDPLVRKYIDDPQNLKNVCDHEDGWYKHAAMTAIRNIARNKYAYLRDNGKPAPNSLSYQDIEDYEREMQKEQD